MTLTNLLLIVGSAFVHVVAHVALRRARDRIAFVWWMLLWAGVLFSPVLILGRQTVSAAGWALILLSSAFEALYFSSIAKAYQSGDLSVIYPLARGAAPVFLVLSSAVILRERPTPGGLAGVALIALGAYLVNLPRLGAWRAPLRALGRSGPRWALFAGWCISLYTAIDKIGVRLVSPAVYIYLGVVLAVAWITPGTLRSVGWGGLRRELASSRFSSLIAGCTTMVAYVIVLYAMQRGAPATYAGAVREVSVVIGAVIGVTALKEEAPVMRLLGSGLVGGGVGAIALFG